MTDIWSKIPEPAVLGNEADVEQRLVLPLLRALGYDDDDIAPKYPVVFQEGRAGRKPEADFVCFAGLLRTRDNSLVAVEVKRPGEDIGAAKNQGESYAQNLRAPLLLITDGITLEVWQMQITMESHCVLKAEVAELTAQRGEVERLLNKAAVIDFCKALSHKSVVDATMDFGLYEKAELRRMMKSDPSIVRTVKREGGECLESNRLLDEFSSGAIVVAPSGYGKTTFSIDLFNQAMGARWHSRVGALPFHVPLPDLESAGVSLLTFIHQRLSAHHRGVTEASFGDLLKGSGAIVICDGFDRVTHPFQHKISGEIANLLRDYPCSKLYIFSRTMLKPNVALPSLDLVGLSDDQMLELERICLRDVENAQHSLLHAMSSTLRSLCRNPLILSLALRYWTSRREFPRKIDFIFQEWLDALLETEPNDHVSKVLREAALTALAKVTSAAPVTGIRAIEYLRENNFSESVINQLMQCDAIRFSGTVCELQHEALADYLRCKAFVSVNEEQQLRDIAALSISAGSLFPVLLMSKLNSRKLQGALWEHLSGGSIDIYLEALRYRFDVSNELSTLDTDKLSHEYLSDLLDGIEMPLHGLFPRLHASIMRGLTGEDAPTFAVIGRFFAEHGIIQYRLKSRNYLEPRITVADPWPPGPGAVRAVNLDLSRYRIDSGRLLGMTLLRDSLLDSIVGLELAGGPLWAAERLLGRIRYLIEEQYFPFQMTDSLESIFNILKPLAGGHIDGRPYSKEMFPVSSLLDDVATLRASGVTHLDPWWLRLGWDYDAFTVSEDVYRSVLDEEYRLAQTVYAEIVRNSFPDLASNLPHFSVLPIRWSLTVTRSHPNRRLPVIHFSWVPVESWKDAGADVSFSKTPPEPPDWQAVRNALNALGRPSDYIGMMGGWRMHFPYDGRLPTGYFSGATSVTNEVCSWLKDDIKRLFDGLPSNDGAF